MANRLSRDNILLEALKLVDSPTLDQKERPAGTIDPTAFGIGILQRAVDYFYKCFPIKGTLTTSTVTVADGDASFTLPAGALVLYQDPLVWQDNEGRVSKRGLDYILTRRDDIRGVPRVLAQMNETTVLFRPASDKARSGTLYYYSLPNALASGDIPSIPDDQILVDLMEVAYKEWLGSVPKGSALQYAKSQVKELQKAGFGAEAEPDQIPFDRQAFPGTGPASEDADWMGAGVVGGGGWGF